MHRIALQLSALITPRNFTTYLFQACLRGEYLILAYPYVGTTVGPRVIPNFGISSHRSSHHIQIVV